VLIFLRSIRKNIVVPFYNLKISFY